MPMADTVTPAQRRRNMQAIRSKHTGPELLVRKFLHRRGFRYRLHDPTLPGQPDIVLKRFGAVVFVHGCFWHRHGCSRSVLPKSRESYWYPKLANNVRRHKQRLCELDKLGWRVITVWECETHNKTLRQRLLPLLRAKSRKLKLTKDATA